MSFTKRDRKLRPDSRKDLQSAVTTTLAQAISVAIRSEYGEARAALKSIGADTGANERAIKNWLQAKNSPSAEHLLRLCRCSDEVLETFLTLADRKDILALRKVSEIREQLLLIQSRINQWLEAWDHNRPTITSSFTS